MTTITELIEQQLDNGTTHDPYRIAANIITAVNPAELVPLLADHIAHIIRHRTRENERAAYRTTLTRTTAATPTPAATTTPDFRALAAERFSMGNGENVRWMEATVDDHLARIAYLTKMRNGIDDTIERHRAAVHLIQSAGVTTLEQALATDAAAA